MKKTELKVKKDETIIKVERNNEYAAVITKDDDYQETVNQNEIILTPVPTEEETFEISNIKVIDMNQEVKNTFILQGVLIGMSGVFLGLFFGIMISFLQQETGFVKINLPNSIINAYPVKIEAYDVFLITIIVLIISSIASIFPSIITSSTKNFENTSNNLS